jgi:hypothetical protein
MQHHSMIEEIRRDEAALVFAKDNVNREQLKAVLSAIQASLPLHRNKMPTAIAV